MTLGQILPDSPFGKALTKLAETSENIVEIGTWHGMGSTLCLQLGMIRPSQRMWTIEPDDVAFNGASKRWSNEPRITFIQGRALEVADQLPDRIDLLLIDGDDASGFSEFKLFSPRCHIVAMDDTNEFKSRESLEYAMLNGWTILEHHINDRHGWAIVQRPQ